jgi:peptidoglycan/LPS O-acetylase OafA/YrhL
MPWFGWLTIIQELKLKSMNIKKGNFRNDINGLRAWAVVAVILYHFGVLGFSGGFVGVDIFFVISGFLMTGIIAKGLADSQAGGKPFSVLDFYISRARRILPALIVVCGFVIILGWVFLSPVEYRALGVHVISALGFFSNMIFWKESGYFDAASHDKFLLHTWSLSVEWQFYIILPLVMVAVWRVRPGNLSLRLMVVLGFLFSLTLSIVITPLKPSAAFYLLPTRAWEMFAGGIVYLVAANSFISSRLKLLLEGVGFLIIIASIALFDQSSRWPGWHALAPVVGTVLVLLAAREGSWLSSTRVAQWVGDCSYSLYLWHWPFVVALVYLNRQGQGTAIIAGLFMTLICGWMSYRFIETPARLRLTKIPNGPGIIIIIFGMLIVGIPSAWVYLKNGVPSRLSPQNIAVFDEADNKNPRLEECAAPAYGIVSKDNPVPNCRYGDEGYVKAVIIGDSHSSSLATSLKSTVEGGDVLQWSANACPFAIGIQSDSEKYRCNDFVIWAIKEAETLPVGVPVVIANRYSAYVYGPNGVDTGLAELVTHFKIGGVGFGNNLFPIKMREGLLNAVCNISKHRDVYLVRPVPEMAVNVPTKMGRSMMAGKPVRVSVSLEEYHERHSFVLKTLDLAAERCGAKILDPLPYLCEGMDCWGDLNGLPIYFDDDHLNERGSQILRPMFKQIFDRKKNEKSLPEGLSER